MLVDPALKTFCQDENSLRHTASTQTDSLVTSHAQTRGLGERRPYLIRVSCKISSEYYNHIQTPGSTKPKKIEGNGERESGSPATHAATNSVYDGDSWGGTFSVRHLF
jgi:hypothetical protein